MIDWQARRAFIERRLGRYRDEWEARRAAAEEWERLYEMGTLPLVLLS